MSFWRFTRSIDLKASLAALLFMALVILPTTIASAYYFVLASDRYVVESKFTVRSIRGSQSGGLSSLFRTIGIARAEDDTYAVINYLLSRDAVREVGPERLRRVFGNKAGDVFSRYHGLLSADNSEKLYEYYLGRVDAWYQSKGGLVTLRVAAFNPVEAKELSETLLRLSEGLINRLNERARSDAIAYAERQLTQAELLVVDAQKALTAFRNAELLIDPLADTMKILELMAQLKKEAIDTQRQLEEALQTSPSSPSIPGLRSRISALEQQMDKERAKIVGGDDPLASKVSAYERLTLAKDFADRNLTLAFNALQAARQEAQRKQLYIETVVSPHLPDEAIEPRRFRAVFTVLTVCFSIFAMLWLVIAGSREHMHG